MVNIDLSWNLLNSKEMLQKALLLHWILENIYAKHLSKREVRCETPLPVTSTAAQLCPLHHHPPSLFCKSTQNKRQYTFLGEKPREALLTDSLCIGFNHCVLFHHLFLEISNKMTQANLRISHLSRSKMYKMKENCIFKKKFIMSADCILYSVTAE